MKHFYFLFLFTTTYCFSQLTPPSELQAYYQNVDFTLTGTALYDDLAIETIAKHATFLDYSDRHDYLYDADEDLSNISNVILIYNSESRDEDEYLSGNNPHSPQTFNTEHVYPQSLIVNTAIGDLHHLRVCDITINGNRGNDPFTSGSGTYGSTGSGWYPGDEWKGDVARMIMYLNLRYNEPFTDVGTLNLFLQWNAEDPVSPIEDQRNTVISAAQGNRNPFIDNPYLATVIWGGSNAENRWGNLSITDVSILNVNIFPNPVHGNVLNIKSLQTLSVTIFDVLGKKIITQKIDPRNPQFNVSSLNKGIYLLKLVSSNGNITKKLIRN